MGIRQAVIRYGTLIPDSNNLKSDAILVSVCDTMAAILAGFVVIPTAFAGGMEVSKGPALLFDVMAGIYGKMSIINDVKNPVFSVAPFALIDVYLSFYDKVRLQTELTTGSIFYLPTNFAYELTFMLNVELMKDLSIGASLTTGLADNFTETFFSNRFEYSTFVNWGYTL